MSYSRAFPIPKINVNTEIPHPPSGLTNYTSPLPPSPFPLKSRASLTRQHPLTMINTAPPSTAQLSPPETPNATQLSIKFWGVRGSVPTPTKANQRYGGNTICVEILLGNQRIIFDAGTGLVGLGQFLQQQDAAHQAHLFFTHTHWDRIQGFPFFQPAFTPGNHFSVYGGVAPNGASIKHCLTDQMLKPYFSMPLQNMRAELAFHTLSDHTHFCIDDISVETLQINAYTDALGYRLTWQGHTIVYATDTPTERIDFDFLDFVKQADILIYDGTYCDLTYLRESLKPTLQPWEIGLELAQKGSVKELVLLHHSPMQDDDTLDRLQKRFQQKSNDCTPQVTVAYEGMVLSR
ncbi:MAG: MBL fold metallo-hydrolase [Phormidesmis sp.]